MGQMSSTPPTTPSQASLHLLCILHLLRDESLALWLSCSSAELSAALRRRLGAGYPGNCAAWGTVRPLTAPHHDSAFMHCVAELDAASLGGHVAASVHHAWPPLLRAAHSLHGAHAACDIMQAVQLANLVTEYDVDAYFNGHDHTGTHSDPLHDGVMVGAEPSNEVRPLSQQAAAPPRPVPRLHAPCSAHLVFEFE